VTEGVDGATRRRESEFTAKQPHVPRNVVTAQSRLCATREEQVVRRAFQVLAVAKHRLPKSETERDNPLLASLTVQRHEQIVKVNLLDSYVEGLVLQNATDRENPLVVNNVVDSPEYGVFSEPLGRALTARLRLISTK
jgi:hypothetical protein